MLEFTCIHVGCREVQLGREAASIPGAELAQRRPALEHRTELEDPRIVVARQGDPQADSRLARDS